MAHSPVPRSAVIVAHGSPSDPESQEGALRALASSVEAHMDGWRIGSATLAAKGRLEAEIGDLGRPLIYPFFMARGWFTGQVLANGEPVAGAEIEIEYMAAEPDMDSAASSAPTVSPMAGGSVVAVSDADGYFTFGVAKAGYWGFAALGSGPATEHEGKELSQDAVIWIRAWNME